MENKNEFVTWCKIVDGYYTDVIETSGNTPKGDGWVKCPKHVINNINKKREWFDNDHNPIDEKILIEKGIRKDNRGIWYSKENRDDNIQINELDEIINDDYTKEVPLENEVFQFFDKSKNKWVVDTKKKERAEKERELNKLKAEIIENERKLIRPLRAMQKGRATDEDIKMFDKLDSDIENARPKIIELEADLKSA